MTEPKNTIINLAGAWPRWEQPVALGAAGRAGGADHSMSTHSIAVIAGDGIGKEVVPAVIECLERIVELHGLNLEFTCFGRGSDYYGRHGRMMPADELELLAKHDAISLGAPSAHRKSPTQNRFGAYGSRSAGNSSSTSTSVRSRRSTA
jgi:hypothetical protein